MKCQRSGQCCITMAVIVPVWTLKGVRARYKPGDMPCPHLSYEGPISSCAVHDTPEYQGSPCWTYGNSDVDPDFLAKKGKPCPVGKLIQDQGGVPLLSPERLTKRVRDFELEDLGPWPTQEERVPLHCTKCGEITDSKNLSVTGICRECRPAPEKDPRWPRL